MPFYRAHVLVCCGNTCAVRGGRALLQLLAKEVEQKGLAHEIRVVETGCLGISEHGPAMVVYPEGVVYAEPDVPVIVEEHLLSRIVDRLVYRGQQAAPRTGGADVFRKQQKIILQNCSVLTHVPLGKIAVSRCSLGRP